MYPVSYTNTNHDVTGLANCGVVKNITTCISWEQNITFLWNEKKILTCVTNYAFCEVMEKWTHWKIAGSLKTNCNIKQEVLKSFVPSNEFTKSSKWCVFYKDVKFSAEAIFNVNWKPGSRNCKSHSNKIDLVVLVTISLILYWQLVLQNKLIFYY